MDSKDFLKFIEDNKVEIYRAIIYKVRRGYTKGHVYLLNRNGIPHTIIGLLNDKKINFEALWEFLEQNDIQEILKSKLNEMLGLQGVEVSNFGDYICIWWEKLYKTQKSEFYNQFIDDPIFNCRPRW